MSANQATILIAAAEARLKVDTTKPLEEQMRAAMEVTKDFWMSTDEDVRFNEDICEVTRAATTEFGYHDKVRRVLEKIVERDRGSLIRAALTDEVLQELQSKSLFMNRQGLEWRPEVMREGIEKAITQELTKEKDDGFI